MECYLAGATDTSTAGENPIKNGKAMELYLAGENGKTKAMELWSFIQKIKSPLWDNISILESFFYVSKNKVFPTLLKKGIYKKILLDSGAFTFMQSSKTNINWEDYINQYADFINANDIKLFFELDIDGIIGLDNVERLRDRLYRLTGKYPIPVWHINRGKQYFIDMCKSYPYVALGGIAGAGDKATRQNAKKYFPWFINIAHKYGSKIHGLGFTEVENLKIYKFDSVDSTAWLYGNRGGYIYKFDPLKCRMEYITKQDTRSDGITYDSMIIDTGNYYSLCEHHSMPFFGKYWFAYIPNPNGLILGLSKIGRVVDYCAAKLQIQERLVSDIVTIIQNALGDEFPPLGIALIMKGRHLCKEMRGARKQGEMTSSYLTGLFKVDSALRNEFLSIAR